ncbi:unnamed protein product [Phyllotreta striolata]|uniref:acid phosphatase n=1 Tax=Phyllotreta striolata TaxID=444603 RepID=A0A9N9TPE7_PHYSR|nr:unnamed protein product [Phyllotreta striolata]
MKMEMMMIWMAALMAFAAGVDLNNFTNEDYKIVFPNREDEGTLKLSIVLFRHGNRTPNGVEELYPNDPHLNFTYFPYGLGQLTNAGKVKLYSIGVSLRKRYNNFLGKYYYPDIVEAVSTDYNRTKMSLELVLAGLFPPRQEELMAAALNWQPIPYNYLPLNEDKVLVSHLCPRYKLLYKQHAQRPEVLQRYQPYRNLFDFLSERTGKEIRSFRDVYHLYFGLSTEEEFGLQLPDWTKTVWPEPISSLAAEEYFVELGTPDMQKLLVGYLLDEVLRNLKRKMFDRRKLSKKLYLYSAHESNLAYLLIALGVFEKHRVPPYGAHVVLELHLVDGVYGVKVFYEAWDGSGLRLMKMVHCKEFCPFDVFESLMRKFVPSEDVCGYL